MKYFIDTEFHEYKKQPTVCGLKVGKPIDTIELISIGIVSEDIPVYKDGIKQEYVVKGREYYTICKEFDLKAAWNNEWLRENVLTGIYKELRCLDLNWSLTSINHIAVKEFKLPSNRKYYKEFKKLLSKHGKTRKQIAEEIIEFINSDIYISYKETNTTFKGESGIIYEGKPEFYAYYADYDWVVFCWLFGRMIDLPNGFPMYCIDLKQEWDSKINNLWIKLVNEAKNRDYNWYKTNNPVLEFGSKEDNTYFHKSFTNKELMEKMLKDIGGYPKQTNEHNALADAKWNYELYKFLNTL